MRTMAYGDGSLVQRRSGPRAGEWIKRYKTADGRWHATSWKAKPTRAMVTARLAELLRSPDPPLGESLSAYLDRWLRDGTTHLRPRTVGGYRVLVDGSVRPVLGGLPLAGLSTPAIQRWVNDGATSHALAVLRAALSEAVRWGLIPVNPATAVRLPKRERKDPIVLTPDQTRSLLTAVKGDPLEALYVLAVYTGMRQGEILGLRWQDIDWQAGTLTVKHSLWWFPDPKARRRAKHTRRPGLTEPKTTASRRPVKLAQPVIDALRKHQRNQPNDADARITGLVFTQPNGDALQPGALWNSFQRHLATAGLPKMPFHSLRHSAATNLIAAGVPVPIVSDLLRHATVTTTLSVYRHAVERTQDVAAEAMIALLREETG